MAGSSIQVDFQIQGFADSLKRARELGADLTPLMQVIGVGLVKTTQHRFDTATDPQRNPWKALNPAYAENKQGAGILREKAMRGGLQGSITYKVLGAHEVAVGSDRKYAAAHQFGVTIVPRNAKALVFRLGNRLVRVRKVVLPARPYLGLGAADREQIQDAFNRVMGGIFGVI